MRKKLRHLRVEHNLTQDNIAERLGITRTTYSKIESGKSNGSTAFWMALKREFPEVNIDELLQERGEENEAENHSA